MARVTRILKWLLAIAAVALFALAAYAYRDATRVRDVMANGTETTALVDGRVMEFKGRGGPAYAVDLVWRDAAGGELKARGLWIGEALAKQLSVEAAGDPPSLLIKYLPEGAPVIVRQAALDQEINGRHIALGAIGGTLCALGFAVLAFLGRRRAKGS